MKIKKGIIKRREYPTLVLDRKKVLKIVESINRFGGTATRQQLEEDTGLGVWIGTAIASAKRYGLIEREEGSANLKLTDLGIAYTSADESAKNLVIIKTILNVPHYNKLVCEKNFYKEPSLAVLKQIMINYGIPKKDSGAVAGIFRRTLSTWDLTFKQLKESLVSDSESIETVSKEASNLIESSKRSISTDKVVSGTKLAWTISYLKHSYMKMDKPTLLKVLDSMLRISDQFKELKKEIEATIKFSKYSDENGIKSYIKDHFEGALAKDLGIDDISDLIESKERKTKVKKEGISTGKEQTVEGKNAPDSTGDES